MLFVDERDSGASTSPVSHLIDNLLAVESVQQVPRAVLCYQPVKGPPGTGRSAGLILRDCVTSREPTAEQRDAIAARDVGEQGGDAPPVNEEGHCLATRCRYPCAGH